MRNTNPAIRGFGFRHVRGIEIVIERRDGLILEVEAMSCTSHIWTQYQMPIGPEVAIASHGELKVSAKAIPIFRQNYANAKRGYVATADANFSLQQMRRRN
jgi:hypothetical protein